MAKEPLDMMLLEWTLQQEEEESCPVHHHHHHHHHRYTIITYWNVQPLISTNAHARAIHLRALLQSRSIRRVCFKPLLKFEVIKKKGKNTPDELLKAPVVSGCLGPADRVRPSTLIGSYLKKLTGSFNY